MLAGAATTLGLFIAGLVMGYMGWQQTIDHESEYWSFYPFGFHPVVFGLAASLVAGVVFSLGTKPPPRAVVARLFLPPAPPASQAPPRSA